MTFSVTLCIYILGCRDFWLRF